MGDAKPSNLFIGLVFGLFANSLFLWNNPTLFNSKGSSVVDFSKIRNSQETTTGVIALKQSLDFEQQNMYKLQIFALVSS